MRLAGFVAAQVPALGVAEQHRDDDLRACRRARIRRTTSAPCRTAVRRERAGLAGDRRCCCCCGTTSRRCPTRTCRPSSRATAFATFSSSTRRGFGASTGLPVDRLDDARHRLLAVVGERRREQRTAEHREPRAVEAGRGLRERRDPSAAAARARRTSPSRRATPGTTFAKPRSRAVRSSSVGLEVLERELAEDRVVRVRDAVARASRSCSRSCCRRGSTPSPSERRRGSRPSASGRSRCATSALAVTSLNTDAAGAQTSVAR